MDRNASIKNIKEMAKLTGMGYYKVKDNGEFLEADEIARELFGIPREETNLSKHSIVDCYIFPAERQPRLEKLKNNLGKPISSTLSLRVNGVDKLLFDQCWYDIGDEMTMTITGLVANIGDRIISAKTFEEFPLGVYQLDDNNKIVHFNKKAMEIFGYTETEKESLLYRNIGEFYVNKEDLKQYSKEVSTQGYAHEILKFSNAQQKVIELECFTEHINEFKKARWGMIHDVTKRERYFRVLDRLPTGYYHIEKEKVTQCNDRFAKIMGFAQREDAIGIDTRDYFVDVEAGKIYFKALDAADAARQPLQGYELQIKRANDKKIITVSIDAHLVRDRNDNVIAREGTIRDVTDRVELENQVKEAQGNLKKTTEDINKIIHTFLHPVVKFSGFSELMNHISKTLQTSKKFDKLAPHLPDDPRELGQQLVGKLFELLEQISSIEKSIDFPGRKDEFDRDEEHDLLFLANLKDKLARIVNRLDYSVETDKKSLVESRIRDTSLWVLDELNKIDPSGRGKLDSLVRTDIIGFLQHILLPQLIRGSGVLMSEVKTMKREVESLRAYIGMKKERNYFLTKLDLQTILEENIEGFKPSLLEKEIDINFISSGNLQAEISGHDIERVIWNLINNALKYSRPGEGRFITLRARELQPANMVEVSIENFGIPIKKEEIDSGKIWEFGYRGEKALESDRDGTGVGLADARDVVNAHGGEIYLTSECRDDSNPPQYKFPYKTVVTIRLPKKQRGETRG